MPPALSDDESSGVGEFSTPPRVSRKSASAGAVPNAPENDVDVNGDGSDEEGDEEEDDEDLDADEYIVESIKKHMIDEDGTIRYLVKWEGYEAKKDMTFEPEDALQESASEALEEYLRSIGGREKIFEETNRAAKTKKRRRTVNGTPSTVSTTKRSRRGDAHPSDSTPPATAKKWSPPAGSWEDEIETIDACEDEGSGKLIVYLIWKNGQKTKHDTDIIYKKCPQKMLQFYERHVKIIRDENKALVDGTELVKLQITPRNLQLFLSTPPQPPQPPLLGNHHLGITTSSLTLIRLSSTANMKRNDVIAIIIIILFVLLAGVSFGIWKLVSMAKNHQASSSSSGSRTEEIADP
ncbi:hypothetical protein FZEAL_9617 [Fusarium zealandicum]|uniref:Chromo domain-containing protein n=1 Tax=Fusarium zealandicum TaxID=1053134 RepID=A0A8H4U9V6_9HYPO|nr:hypothetical protein FZEAL_9617 [Fusarium zealandicum]